MCFMCYLEVGLSFLTQLSFKLIKNLTLDCYLRHYIKSSQSDWSIFQKKVAPEYKSHSVVRKKNYITSRKNVKYQ